MNRKENTTPEGMPRYLNIGCGRQHHSTWVNLDLESEDASVIQHDVTKGIPFEDNHFDAVYHSHVLEHLDPDDGVQLIRECFRVLKPQGVLRVVVPDLERIAKLYLDMHNEAWSGNEDCKINYNWMKLELLDQLVRGQSGGRMGRYMASREIKNSEFVRERVGDELSYCQSHAEPSETPSTKPSFRKRVGVKTMKIRKKMARRTIRFLLGKNAEAAFEEGYFRSQGEIHRWMYDRFSLRDLCSDVGLENFKVCCASESAIPNYESFCLDSANGQIRKPDSIFVECMKPVGTTNPAHVRECENASPSAII